MLNFFWRLDNPARSQARAINYTNQLPLVLPNSRVKFEKFQNRLSSIYSEMPFRPECSEKFQTLGNITRILCWDLDPFCLHRWANVQDFYNWRSWDADQEYQFWKSRKYRANIKRVSSQKVLKLCPCRTVATLIRKICIFLTNGEKSFQQVQTCLPQ